MGRGLMVKKICKYKLVKFIILIVIVISMSCLFLYNKNVKLRNERRKKNKLVNSTCEILKKDYLYVVTEDIDNMNINYYYKIDDNNKLYETGSFEYEKNNHLYVENCLERYENDYGKIFYQYTLNECSISDDDRNKVGYNKDVLNIIKLMAKKYRKRDWWYITILNNEYYVIVVKDGIFYSSNTLLKYKKNHLYKLAVFNYEEIITIKSIN